MRLTRFRAVPILIALAAPAPGQSAPAAPGVLPFLEDDYAGALSQARVRRLPIFVEAWAPW